MIKIKGKGYNPLPSYLKYRIGRGATMRVSWDELPKLNHWIPSRYPVGVIFIDTRRSL